MCWPLVFALLGLCHFLPCQRLTIEEKFYLVCNLLGLTQKCLHHFQILFVFHIGSGLNCLVQGLSARGFHSVYWYQENSNRDKPAVTPVFKSGEKAIRCLCVILCLPFKCSWLSRAEGDLCLVNFWKSVLRQKIIWFRCVLTCLIFEVDGNGWWQDKEQAGGCGEKSQACWQQRGERWSRF